MNEDHKGAIVVTGASAGIGAACAAQLASLGYHVFATVRRDRDGKALIEQVPAGLTPVLMDMEQDNTIASAGEQIGAAVGARGLLGLVNNAGIAVGGPLELMPVADLRRQFETNVIGTAAVTQTLLPLLRQGSGRIVNVGSTSGRVAAPFAGPYAMSKHALRAYTDSLRVELRPWPMHVSLIEVGPVKTGIWDRSLAELDERWENASPNERALYGPLFRAIRITAEARGKSGIPVQQVVDAIVHATTAPKPRTRYIVGKIAWQMAIVSMLPDAVRDRLILRHLRL